MFCAKERQKEIWKFIQIYYYIRHVDDMLPESSLRNYINPCKYEDEKRKAYIYDGKSDCFHSSQNISLSLRKTNTNYNNVEFRINWLFKETRYFVINWSFFIRRFDLIRLLICEVPSNNFLSSVPGELDKCQSDKISPSKELKS